MKTHTNETRPLALALAALLLNSSAPQPATAASWVTTGATNLADWAPVFTNTTPTNVLFYTDPHAGNYP